MNDSLNFQDVILRLLDYWKARGCLVQQPYNVQVGAGTMNPATALRVLGREPWNVVYVEPSVRPDDGRFGDNPNRLQMHHQLQVILKPDPGDPQQIYLDSLKAIGIDPRKHDIRFVEDNWESPALGAWGLGWEVWLDGQEITQFTYFQQAGGLNLDPVSVEITYGLDRIILALQDKDAVWQIDYSDRILYEQVFLQSEIEHCHYYFEVADVDALRQIYDSYERESQRCLDAGLVAPAHDYNLKCSHLFNVLDTRGAIGVTERAHYFKRMRNKARQISELYLEQRQRLEYPLLDEHKPWIVSDQLTTSAIESNGSSELPAQSGPQTLVLEIGCEELPPDDVDAALRQLESQAATMLDDLRLNYGAIEVDGTPRRLALIVKQLAERQTDVEEEVKGPPADRAFDSAGEPTRAALGFARSKGIDVAALRVVDDGDKSYVVATVRETGLATPDVLREALPGLIDGLKFQKSMRWNGSNVQFSRPLRWLIALYGNRVIEFDYAAIHSGHTSRGLRPYGSPTLPIDHADRYEEILYKNNIMLRVQERSDYITRVVTDLAAAEGATVPQNAPLLQEVTNLVEFPTPLVGSFEARYLQLPSEILVAVMRKHQRYFPLYNQNGTLVNRFIAVRNGDSEHLDVVRHGNEQVIRARFADAEFFYNSDRRRKLADFVADLDKLTFQSELGSMKDKLDRLQQLTPAIADLLQLSVEDKDVATRAAALSKADLASMMVVEMTSLQGIMGQVYARQSGESEAVAAAIGEQYESVSATRPGLALALADRIDSLVGLAAAGLLPKGANDPFALRRASIQLTENLVANDISLDLRDLVQLAAAQQPVAVDAEAQHQVLTFIRTRLENLLRDQGYKASVVRAVLNAQPYNPAAASTAVAQLDHAVAQPNWEPLLDAYARTVRITRALDKRLEVDPTTFQQQETRELWDRYQQIAAQTEGTVPSLVAQIESLKPAITRFFDNVLVMAEDQQVRNQRLAVLQHIAALADGIADLSQLEGF